MPVTNWTHLTAFEAVARHRNFTRAAAELNVQQPAISRRVAALETELGVPLVQRTRPSARLTREGEVLFRALTGGLTQIQGALEQVRRRPDSAEVTVNTTIGFASCYLMQRLPAFRAAHPEIAVELVSRDLNDGFDEGAADVVILFEHPDRLPGARRARIFSEVMVPVARPDLAATIPDDPAALAAQPLLHLTLGIHGDDWGAYFAGAGITPPPPRADRRFTSFMVYLQAALNGDGVALGWETLLQNALERGQLTPVSSRRVTSDRGYFACVTRRAADRRAAIAFCDWISATSPTRPPTPEGVGKRL